MIIGGSRTGALFRMECFVIITIITLSITWSQPLPPPFPHTTNFRVDLKISDQNNWRRGRGPDQKNKFGGKGSKFKGGPTILRGHMNPNDVMFVLLKDILFFLLGFRFIYIVYIS